MAGTRKAVALAKRRLGTGEFNERYHSIQDFSMPIEPPPEEQIREEVNLQQTVFRGNIQPNLPLDMVEGSPYLLWERRGREDDERYFQIANELHDVRQASLPFSQFLNWMKYLPPGFRLRDMNLLRGYAIGELVSVLRNEFGADWLRGLYLDADVIDMMIVAKMPKYADDDVTYNHSISMHSTRRLPLWIIDPILPRNQDYPHGFEGGTLYEREVGLENSMSIMKGDQQIIEQFDIDVEETDTDLVPILPGSDLSSYYIVANARLVRRVRSPIYMDNRTFRIRTGGFAELLTETSCIRITLEEVVEAYVEYEGLDTHNFTDQYVEEFKRGVGNLFTVDVFTREDKTIDLIVPGGVEDIPYGGCCVDLCVYSYLKGEYGEQRASESMKEIRERFKYLYCEWRAKKASAGRKRRRTGGEGGEEVEGEEECDILSSAAEKDAVRDLKRLTKHGYSSQIFKFFQRAVYCVTGYLPCIYYHRIEKARDYNQGVRVRMVQVGAGNVGKEILKENEEEVEGGGGGGYTPINMMRINIAGEIHRHKPKSLCMEDTSEFIPDDDTTGLLHAITFYPGISEEFFKGINAKRREVFLSVVEKHTKSLMRYFKRASVGLVTMTGDILRDVVAEQKRRNERGLINTLIYGSLSPSSETGGVTAIPAIEGETPPLTPSTPAPSADPPAKVYYSKTFNKEGQRIPDRPLVIAYDLETVELTEGAVSAGRVGAEFLRSNPNREAYIECERQIPFCVSWVPVNLSDEGRHLALKRDILNQGIQYCAEIREEESWSGSWRESNHYVYCEGGRRVRVGYIMLDEVKVHYGGQILGRCVNEFIEEVVQWAMDRGYTSVHAYAHNGVGFDSYMIQAYNTLYEYHSILKTSRGLLSMRLKVPFTTASNQRKVFPVTFLDTKVFLSFSLSKLCKDFKVPSVWSKLDFPITKVTWKNCYHTEILKVLEPYSVNDTRALAYIIKQINRIVCLETDVPNIPGSDELPVTEYEKILSLRAERGISGESLAMLSELHPPVPTYPKPPITQFCTIMSCVKRVACQYIRKSRAMFLHSMTSFPFACDIPLLRHWVEMASMGGRVSDYAKMYSSGKWSGILKRYHRNDTEGVKRLIREAIAQEDCGVVLDVTSLYPSAMAFCPMPMGNIRYISPEGCVDLISSVGCDLCEKIFTLCPEHRSTLRPFAVILIKGGLKKSERWEEINSTVPLRHIVGRKMKGRKERGGSESEQSAIPGIDVSGVTYTQEEDIEITKRYWGEEASQCDSVFGLTQAMSNVDLYWAWKSGYEFDIIGGVEWETSYELQPLIISLFEMRVTAKEEGNTCLQQAIKLVLNSLFGIHSQRVIRSVDKILTLPQNIKEADVMEEEFGRHIRTNHQKIFDPRMKLKENIPLANGQSMVRAAIPGDIGESVGGYSPNQIGCAVLAWSRHLMSLSMFSISTGHLTYTDTDSLSVSQRQYNLMKITGEKAQADYKIPPLICVKGNYLLTYKNDHSDYFPNARVLFSAIGAKKVKLHVIGCPDTGALKVCSTYKGFLKKDTLDSGDKLHPHQHEYCTAKAILDVLYEGVPECYTGTKWVKELGADGGVTIDRNVTVEGKSSTYLGKHKGLLVMKDCPSQGASVILNVPFGCAEESIKRIEGGRYVEISKVRRGKEGEVATSTGHYPPHLYEYFYPPDWKSNLVSLMGGVTRREMYDFIEKIFFMKESLYRPDEEEKSWDEIVDVFNRVDQEIGSPPPLSSSSSSICLPPEQQEEGEIADLDFLLSDEGTDGLFDGLDFDPLGSDCNRMLCNDYDDEDCGYSGATHYAGGY